MIGLENSRNSFGTVLNPDSLNANSQCWMVLVEMNSEFSFSCGGPFLRGMVITSLWIVIKLRLRKRHK
jgi:hypothetical protein